MSSKSHILMLGALLGVVLLGGCGYDRHKAPTALYDTTLPNAPIEVLYGYADEGVEIAEQVIFAGEVVADDASGNFYRAIVVEDNSGAVEVRMGLYDLAALYPIGCRVVVDAQGLMVTRQNGVLTLGREIYEWSGGRVEAIEPRSEILRRVRVTAKGTPTQPTICSIGDLSERMCGRLTRVEGVRLVEGEERAWGTTDYGTEAERMFEDGKVGRIMVRTSSYADFAASNIPNQEVSITGVLYTGRSGGEDVYVLKMRNLNDVEK